MSFAQSFNNQSSPVLRVNVMVVDDDPIFLQIMSRMLEKSKYRDPSVMEITVIAAKGSMEALSTLKIQGNNIDLIVTDYYMPVMNGLQLKSEITREFGNLPVIVMSSDNEKEEESLTCGAMCFITKPIKANDLTMIYQYALTYKRNGKSIVSTEQSYKNTDVTTIPPQIELLPEQPNDLNIKKKKKKCSTGSNSKSGNSTNGSCVDDDGSPKIRKRKSDDSSGDDVEPDTLQPCKKIKVTWTDDLHDLFLQAIRHIGLDKAVPKKILQYMNVPYLTRENVASHLQKYRMFLRRVAERGLMFSRMLSGRGIDSTYPYANNREPFTNYYTPSASWYDTSLNNRSSSYSKPRQGLGQSRLLSNPRDTNVRYNYMNRSPTYEHNRIGSNSTLPVIKTNLNFSNQRPSQGKGKTSVFEPPVMTNEISQTSQVRGVGPVANGNAFNNNIMSSYGSLTPNQTGLGNYGSLTPTQTGLGSYGSLTPNPTGLNSYGSLTPDQTGLGSYVSLTPNPTGQGSYGSLTPDPTGFGSYGSFTPDQTGLNSYGSFTPDQTGLNNYGSLTPNQTGLSSYGSSNPKQGLSSYESLSSNQQGQNSYGSLTPTQTGLSYGTLTTSQQGLSSYGSLIPNQTGLSSYGSSNPKQQGLSSYESLSPNQQGLSSYGSLTPTQTGLSSYGTLTTNQQGLSSYGSLTPTQTGLSSYGNLTTSHQGLSSYGSLTPNQTGLSSYGTLSPNEPGLESYGTLTPNQQGLSSYGSLTPNQSGSSSFGSLTSYQPGSSSCGSLTLNQSGSSSFGSLTPYQLGSSSFGSLTSTEPGSSEFSFGMQSFLNDEYVGYKTPLPNLEIPPLEKLNLYDDLGNNNELPWEISNFQFGHNKQQGDAASTKFDLPAKFPNEMNQIFSVEDDDDWTFVNINQGHFGDTLNTFAAPEMNTPIFNMNPNQNQEKDVPDFTDWSFLDVQELADDDFMDSLFVNDIN